MENPPVPEHLRNGPHGNAPPSPPQEQNQEEGDQLINADRRLIIQRAVQRRGQHAGEGDQEWARDPILPENAPIDPIPAVDPPAPAVDPPAPAVDPIPAPAVDPIPAPAVDPIPAPAVDGGIAHAHPIMRQMLMEPPLLQQEQNQENLN
ncbi:hypothetical protein DAPPUDRAFT_100103 [Daphnia pulex]|uniref:Uncharacterized protein n=1 Tax=Daphnia pulex TaxID=6669 RepID=E9G9B9_DAPPU|nr:hypothetical protein DAPPUDRAFT_100103 [Daphnia pulex]|eukprot:EFX84110.1 hypothetical protein DAPPUDRAFT_100103 [Daphnia pulex]